MKDINLLSLQVLTLQSFFVSAWQAFPRQTIASNSTNLSKATSAGAPPASTTTVAPCCWIAGQFQGVRINTWASPGTQYVATVITTFLRYNSTIILANSTTITLPANQTYTKFGAWGPGASSAFAIDTNIESYGTGASIPGVATTLVPDDLMTDFSNYGATIALPGNKTFATFESGQEQLTIYSPTPYAVYKLALYTVPPDPTATAYNPATCGRSETVSYISYTSGSWNYVNKLAYLPADVPAGPQGDRSLDNMWEGLFQPNYDYQYVVPLPAPPPNYATGVSIDLPTDASSYLVHNTAILSSVPWITNCFTAGGTGQPTAKVPVDFLTSSSSEYYDVVDPSVTSSPTATVPTALAPTAQQETQSMASSGSGPTTSNQPPKPSQENTASDQGPARGDTTIIEGISRTTTTPLSPIPGPPALTASPAFSETSIKQIGPSAAVVGTASLAVGGPPVTDDGKTFSLISQSSGVAVVIDGTTTQHLQAVSTTNGGQLVTVGGQTLTIDAGAISSQVVVGGVTLKPGSATVINGETISVAGTNLVIASGTSTITQGLGGLIMGGLGESSSIAISTTKQGSDMPYTGAGTDLRPRKFSLGGIISIGVLISLLYT